MNLENQIARKITFSRDYTQGLFVKAGVSKIEIRYRPDFQDYVLIQSWIENVPFLWFFRRNIINTTQVTLNSEVQDFIVEAQRVHHLYTEIQYFAKDGHTCHVTIEFETGDPIHLDWKNRCCPVEWWKIERFFNDFFPEAPRKH